MIQDSTFDIRYWHFSNSTQTIQRNLFDSFNITEFLKRFLFIFSPPRFHFKMTLLTTRVWPTVTLFVDTISTKKKKKKKRRLPTLIYSTEWIEFKLMFAWGYTVHIIQLLSVVLESKISSEIVWYTFKNYKSPKTLTSSHFSAPKMFVYFMNILVCSVRYGLDP